MLVSQVAALASLGFWSPGVNAVGSVDDPTVLAVAPVFPVLPVFAVVVALPVLPVFPVFPGVLPVSPPWSEQAPGRPPEWLHSPSAHCTMYPVPFAKLAMHVWLEQNPPPPVLPVLPVLPEDPLPVDELVLDPEEDVELLAGSVELDDVDVDEVARETVAAAFP